LGSDEGDDEEGEGDIMDGGKGVWGLLWCLAVRQEEVGERTAKVTDFLLGRPVLLGLRDSVEEEERVLGEVRRYCHRLLLLLVLGSHVNLVLAQDERHNLLGCKEVVMRCHWDASLLAGSSQQGVLEVVGI
jgi:hypothetical protein